MGSHVYAPIGLESVLHVPIARQVLVRRRAVWVLQDLTDLTCTLSAIAAPLRLYHNGHIAIGNACDQKPPVQHHGLARGSSPTLPHAVPRLLTQALIIRLILRLRHGVQDSAAVLDILGASPSKIAVGFAVHDLPIQRLPVLRYIPQRISLIPHSL